MQRPVGPYHFAQGAVYSKPHAGMALIGLYVNVTGAVAGGLGQKRVKHANDGRVVRRFKQVFYRWQFLHDA